MSPKNSPTSRLDESNQSDFGLSTEIEPSPPLSSDWELMEPTRGPYNTRSGDVRFDAGFQNVANVTTPKDFDGYMKTLNIQNSSQEKDGTTSASANIPASSFQSDETEIANSSMKIEAVTMLELQKMQVFNTLPFPALKYNDLPEEVEEAFDPFMKFFRRLGFPDKDAIDVIAVRADRLTRCRIRDLACAQEESGSALTLNELKKHLVELSEAYHLGWENDDWFINVKKKGTLEEFYEQFLKKVPYASKSMRNPKLLARFFFWALEGDVQDRIQTRSFKTIEEVRLAAHDIYVSISVEEEYKEEARKQNVRKKRRSKSKKSATEHRSKASS